MIQDNKLPPAGIEPDDLLKMMMAAPVPHRIVDFPRKDKEGVPLFDLAMMLLTQDEVMAVSAAAEKATRRAMGDDIPKIGQASKGYDDLFNNFSAIEILYRACKHPADLTKPLFPTKEFIKKQLTPDEVAILFNNYMTIQIELGPVIGSLSSEEIDAWVKKLAEGGERSSTFLDSFSWAATKGLLITMAVQLHDLRTVSSSAGLPQEELTISE